MARSHSWKKSGHFPSSSLFGIENPCASGQGGGGGDDDGGSGGGDNQKTAFTMPFSPFLTTLSFGGHDTCVLFRAVVLVSYVNY